MKFKNFIRATDAYSTCSNNIPAPILRKSFNIDFIPEKSSVAVCVAGFYELYINGINITVGKLAPFINNPDHLLYYDEYDLSAYLKKGRNAISVILGNGFSNQDIPRQSFNTAPFRAPLVLGLSMHAIGEHKEFSLESDESFKINSSPILFDMYRFGEIYDARKEIAGFAEADFDDYAWSCAKLATPPKGTITRATNLPIRIQYELEPKSVEKQTDFYYFYDNDAKPFKHTYVKEGWCYDFGYCRAGVCKLKIKGDKGQKITIRHGEELRFGNKFNMNSIFTIRDGDDEFLPFFQADTYILKGGEEEIYIPRFTYHGFQYALVEGLKEEQATKDLLTFIVFNTDIEKRSDFNCSDNIINQIYTMAIQSDLSNFQHIPTDCPSREKSGWTGDVSVSACQFLLSFDCSDNLKMWFESVRCAQTAEGMLPGIVPTNTWGYEWGNGPVWDCVIVNVPYYIYRFCGRTDIIKENSDMIFRYINFIAGKRDEKGLIAFGLGDWCQPINQPHTAPLSFVSSSQIYESSLRAAFLFDLIGKQREKEYSLKLAQELKNAIRKELIDFTTYSVSGDCQTSQSVALKVGLFEDEEYEKAYNRLLEIIKRDDHTISVGLYGLRYLFHVLFKNGDSDLALAMITKKDAPSYRDMIDRGATALFESLTPNGMNESRNHHFFGDVINLFITKLAGLNINPCLNDIHDVLIEPIIPDSIERAYAEYKFENNEKVKVSWKKENSKVVIDVEMPSVAHGCIRLNGKCTELKNGQNIFLI